MTVTVLYFAALRELLGLAEEQLAIGAAGLSVSQLAEQLLQRHPELGPYLASVRFAVNESFVDATARVAPGDTLALIPPVSGG